MSTWIMDTAMITLLATPRAAPLLHWCEANNADLFLSAASLTEIVRGIDKMPPGQAQRAQALRHWVAGLPANFADRIHPVDAAIAMRAGGLLRNLPSNGGRRPFHDAILVATAQAHGHGLLTRRDTTFGLWTQTPIAVV